MNSMLMALTPRSANFWTKFLFIEWIQQACVNRARLEPGNFLHRRFAQPQHDVAGPDEFLAVGGDDGTGLEIGLVGKTGGGAEAGLDFDLRAELDEFGGAVRREGRAVSHRDAFLWELKFSCRFILDAV